MLRVVFMPKKYAPVKSVEYLVAHWNHQIAEEMAAEALREDLGIKAAHYDEVVIAEARVLR